MIGGGYPALTYDYYKVYSKRFGSIYFYAPMKDDAFSYQGPEYTDPVLVGSLIFNGECAQFTDGNYISNLGQPQYSTGNASALMIGDASCTWETIISTSSTSSVTTNNTSIFYGGDNYGLDLYANSTSIRIRQLGIERGTITGIDLTSPTHIAIVFNGTNCNVYVNGQQKLTFTDAIYADIGHRIAANYRVGYGSDGSNVYGLLITNRARYLSNFTPPTDLFDCVKEEMLASYNIPSANGNSITISEFAYGSGSPLFQYTTQYDEDGYMVCSMASVNQSVPLYPYITLTSGTISSMFVSVASNGSTREAIEVYNVHIPAGTQITINNSAYQDQGGSAADINHACTLLFFNAQANLTTETLLWENSSPTSEYAGQNITLSQNINNFKKLKFVFYVDTTNENAMVYEIDVNNLLYKSGLYNYIGLGVLQNDYYCRFVGLANNLTINGNQLSFTGGIRCRNFNTINSVLVPYRVYGVNPSDDNSNINDIIYLFKDGVVNEDVTGGITLQNITNQNGKLNFATNTSSSCYFNNQINTDGYKLGIEFINNHSSTGHFLICKTPLDNSTPYVGFDKQYSFLSNSVNSILIDTQGEPTQVRLFNSYGASGDCVSKIWLEKV